MLSDTAVTLIGGAIEWLVYSLLLWIMIKIQRLNYSGLGLLASAAIATGLTYIPVVGCYLAWAVLVILLWKCTGASIAPDVLFTVGITGALMFCFHLFALGAMMGQLRPDLVASDAETDGSAVVDAKDDEVPPAHKTPAKPEFVMAQNHPEAKNLALKGIALHSERPLAMIASGSKVYTLGPGEGVSMQFPKGMFRFQCEEIKPSYVMLRLAGGEKVRLPVEQ
jgi:hypothetical protein